MTTTSQTQRICQIVMDAMDRLNLSREPSDQLNVSPEAPIFGADSRLDSLGLVSLLIEVEEGLRDNGWDVSLSDERAISQKHSPFRSVPALVEYIERSITSSTNHS